MNTEIGDRSIASSAAGRLSPFPAKVASAALLPLRILVAVVAVVSLVITGLVLNSTTKGVISSPQHDFAPPVVAHQTNPPSTASTASTAPTAPTAPVHSQSSAAATIPHPKPDPFLNLKTLDGAASISRDGTLNVPNVHIPANYTSLFTDHVYVINLKRRPDRLHEMQRMLRYYHIRADFFEATDAETYTHPRETTLKSGRIACWQSHLRIWKDIVDRKYRHAFIFEDDADIDVNIHAKMVPVMRYLPEDFDTAYIGHCAPEEYQKPLLTTDFPDLHLSKFPVCNHGYMVSYKGAKKLIQKLQDVKDPFDVAIGWMNWGGALKSYSMVPILVAQRRPKNAKSDVDGSLFSGPTLILNSVARPAWDRIDHFG
ncbi:hypothetical protein GQ42DRAFT_160875 [Ramicandelaber brevisporus]|nr:hypothetical protein GQ42DRAFT_160875 [Ramicandelaber brevisporus]